MTTADAAALLGLTARSVARLIKIGALAAEKRGRDYWIEADEITRYREARRPVGRPRGAIGMNTQQMADAARAMVTNGDAPNIERAVAAVVRETLQRIAGTFTPRAERDWYNDVLRIAKR